MATRLAVKKILERLGKESLKSDQKRVFKWIISKKRMHWYSNDGLREIPTIPAVQLFKKKICLLSIKPQVVGTH